MSPIEPNDFLDLSSTAEHIQKFIDKNKLVCALFEQKRFDEFIETAPLFVAKLIDYMGRLKRKMYAIEKHLKERESAQYTYYKFDFNIKLNNSEVKEFLERDTMLQEISFKQKEIASYIETLMDIKKNIENSRYDIKNWIEYKKLKIEMGLF